MLNFLSNQPPNQQNNGPTCAFPGCTKPCHVGYTYCGRTHGQQHAAMLQQQQQQQASLLITQSNLLIKSPSTPPTQPPRNVGVGGTCKMPGCNRAVFMDDYDYCSLSHGKEHEQMLQQNASPFTSLTDPTAPLSGTQQAQQQQQQQSTPSAFEQEVLKRLDIIIKQQQELINVLAFNAQ